MKITQEQLNEIDELKMKMTQEQLDKIVAAHKAWYWSSGKDGERISLRLANLGGANLRHADLINADLSDAYLDKANLSGANLSGANLEGAVLTGANLRRTNLYNTNLSNANLFGADLTDAEIGNAYLSCAILDKTYYQIVRVGSRNDTITYCVEDDNVFCGCWNNYKGGTLAEFKEHLESVYGENGETPNKKYYAQYMAAIEFFKKMAELAEEEQ